MILASEYNTRPRVVLTYNPALSSSLNKLRKLEIDEHNFESIPEFGKLRQQHQDICDRMRTAGIRVVDITKLMDKKECEQLAANPNSMFVRDPLITLPWAPELAIVANMKLAGRAGEPALLKKAARAAGIKSFITPPEYIYLEGGDFTAVSDNGKRTLYIGIGERTSLEAGLWLAETLIPKNMLDEIVCMRHNQALLHLDTCFCILPNQTIVTAKDALQDGFVIDHNLKVRPMDARYCLLDRGYKLFDINRNTAEDYESCNMLFLGDMTYLSFKQPPAIAAELQRMAGIFIEQVDGSEISKGNGGIHCLTRPLY
jgi:N-dimethylarginine dimethylaminohydrolase